LSALVSVLIPCFNAARTIAAAVESVRAQTYPHREIVVVDDGSSDGSQRVLHELEAPDLRWVGGPNGGACAARNRALALAKGEFVQFLDADDLLEPTKLERQVAALTPEADVALSAFRIQPIGSSGPGHVMPQVLGEDDPAADAIRTPIWTASPLHRRHLVEAAGAWRVGLACCQEYEFHVRCALRVWRRVAHVTEALAVQRRQAGSVSADESRVFLTTQGLLDSWASELAASGGMTARRRDALVEASYTCGRRLARRGHPSEAKQAFGLSRRLSPSGRLPTRGAMTALTRLVGPLWAERLRSVLRQGS
jgi:hypothetical protein